MERWAREGPERGSSLAGLYGLACVVRVSCMVHKISLAPWGEVAPVRGAERGNSLAGLYGLVRLVRFICVVHKMSLALWG